MTINEFLVRHLRISGKNALALIAARKVLINEVPAVQQQTISDTELICCEEKVLQTPYEYLYLVYYKPRGIECTMNREIAHNLADALPEYKDIFPVGRLDKDSEGLLILTNDGQLYKQIAPAEAMKEKEYLVTVDKILTEECLQKLSEGIVIMGKQTRPASVAQVDPCSFRMILTQGLNRQIRRMCYKLGYKVVMLKRIRILSLTLGELQPGEYRLIRKEQILA